MSHPPRRTKRTLNIVAALYVVIGFCVAVPAAFSGNRLNAFLGFLIISGALAAAAVIAPVLRIAARMAAIDDHLRDLRNRLRRIESAAETRRAGERGDTGTRQVNLARLGRGDPAVLAAATLERDVFPRLVATMDEEPPADGSHGATKPRSHEATKGACLPAFVPSCLPPTPAASEPSTAVTSINLLREWKAGMREGDLPACRAVYSALVDTVDPPMLASLEEQLELLADRTEASLRLRFAECVRDRDLAGIAEVGEEITRVLPDRPIADEVRRIQPLLLRRLAGGNSDEREHPSLLRTATDMERSLFAGTSANPASLPDKRAGSE